MEYLILDIGGSSIKFGILNQNGDIKEKGSIEAPRESLDQFIESIGKLYDSYRERINGIGISMPGVIDPENGFAYTGGAYHFIKDTPIVDLLSQRCPTRITVGNDAKCAAYAEIGFGSLKDANNASVIILGTGIGGAVIQNRKVLNGNHFAAGEFSWIRSHYQHSNDMDYLWCGLNGIGGLLKLAQKHLKTEDKLTGKDIFEMANAGNQSAIDAIDEFCYYLVIHIYNIQTMLDPDKIAVGGGISIQPLLFELINKNIDAIYNDALKYNCPIARPQVVICEYFNDAAILGAFYQHIQ